MIDINIIRNSVKIGLILVLLTRFVHITSRIHQNFDRIFSYFWSKFLSKCFCFFWGVYVATSLVFTLNNIFVRKIPFLLIDRTNRPLVNITYSWHMFCQQNLFLRGVVTDAAGMALVAPIICPLTDYHWPKVTYECIISY